MFLFSSLKLQYCGTIVLLNKLKLSFLKTSFLKATMVMRFADKKNTGCPKAPRDFPPRKDGILHPRWVASGLPSPSPRVCTRGRTYADVTTKISRIDSLPDLFTHGALQAPLLLISLVIIIMMMIMMMMIIFIQEYPFSVMTTCIKGVPVI